MKFRSLFSRKSFPSPSGSRYRKSYVKSIEGGKSSLIENGVEDVYDSIQKAALGVTIEDLIRRARNGDTTAIGEPLDSYMDLSNAPKDLLEAHEMIKGMKNSFYGLPADVRAKYGNSFDSFLDAVNNGTVYGDLAAVNSSSSPASPAAEIKEKILGGNSDA